MSAESAYVPALVRWFVVVVVAALILIAAVVRPGQGVDQPGPLGLWTADLWLHAAAYFVLQLSVVYAMRGGGESLISPAVTTVFTIAYGCFVEGLQLLIAYRTFSDVDLLANAVGGLAGLACYELFRAMVAREAMAA